jgi:hypothetical protein
MRAATRQRHRPHCQERSPTAIYWSAGLCPSVRSATSGVPGNQAKATSFRAVLFGAHCSGGIKKAIDAAEGMGADVVQLFVQSPRTWRFPNHDPATLERFRERRAESGLGGVLVHALYLVNLAAPDKAIYSKSVDTMRSTVDAACAIEADGVVFHIGSHLGAGFDKGLKRVVPALEQVLEGCSETKSSPSSSTRSAATSGSVSASTPATSTSPGSTSPTGRR